MLCNASSIFQCANDKCINISATCNGVDDCIDGSDETFTLCAGGFKVTGTIIAGIVIGVVVGIAILCCLVGTVVDCFVHIYKYWCSCLHKAYHYQTEMTTFRSPRHSPSEPTNLVVRALPPSYSAITLPCESPTAQRPSDRDYRFDPEAFGFARELKVIENYNYYVKKAKASPKGMPPSYSSLFLRDEFGEERVILNTAMERESLIRSSPDDDMFLTQPSSSSHHHHTRHYRRWDMSPT